MLRKVLSTAKKGAVACALVGLAGTAGAVSYDFKIVGGNRIYDYGRSICMDVAQTSPNTILFTIRPFFPQSVSNIVTVAFDTGKYADLFTDVSVLVQSSGNTILKRPPSDPVYRPHAYLPGFAPKFGFRKEGTTLYHPGGINSGEMIALSATLGPGRTANDVMTALGVGGNPATASNGLRVGVIAHHLKGVRRNPMVTEGDDAGFVSNAVSTRCQPR
jgi:hypothetical protein